MPDKKRCPRQEVALFRYRPVAELPGARCAAAAARRGPLPDSLQPPAELLAGIKEGNPRLAPSTVHRLLKGAGLMERPKAGDGRDRRRFCYQFAGELAMSGVTLRLDGGPSVRTCRGRWRRDPLDVLVWLLNRLGRRGIGLAAGSFILTGSVTEPQPLVPGTCASAVFDGAHAVEPRACLRQNND